MTAAYRFAFLAALALSAACTVHGDKTPTLSGPSEFALSIGVTATPDVITQDGSSQASIAVRARDVNGKGISALRVRLDMSVNGAVQDYGVLSARTVVTDSDGRAAAVYTAPPPPPTLSGGSGNFVTFFATAIGSNYQTANLVSAELRLVPPGVVLPPAGTPTAVFTVTPTPVVVGVPANFDASRSCAGTSACSSTAGITSFAWTFGDGTSGSGQTTTHAFASAGSYTVMLTVTNDRGVSAATSQTVVTTTSALPTADFVFSPTAPQTAGTAPALVSFNAGTSTAAAGRTLAQYTWDFGDGTFGNGVFIQHPYGSPGTYAVVLTVIDDLGGKSTKSTPVTVTRSLPTAAFEFSPTDATAPATINFTAATSHAAPGHLLTRFVWNFGDGSGNVEGQSIIQHPFSLGLTYTVTLTVFDDLGQQAITSKSVTLKSP